MLKIYYTIWVDAITKIKSVPESRDMWKFYTITFISMTMALNLWFISFVLMVHLNTTLPFCPIELNIFTSKKLDAFLEFFISYLLPFLVTNYFLIFYKDKYKSMLIKYKYYNGKLFMFYFIGSIGALFLYFIIAFLILKMF